MSTTTRLPVAQEAKTLIVQSAGFRTAAGETLADYASRAVSVFSPGWQIVGVRADVRFIEVTQHGSSQPQFTPITQGSIEIELVRYLP